MSNNIFTDSDSEEEQYNRNSPSTSSISSNQETTDDENILSLQSSPSPFQSENEQSNSDQDDYLDPELYCLRRSNRQKIKTSSDTDSEETTYTTDEENDGNSSDDNYGEPQRKRKSTKQLNNNSKKRKQLVYEDEEESDELSLNEQKQDSSSDDDWGSNKKTTRKQKRKSTRYQKKNNNNSGGISPSDFARHSTRNKKVPNYNEDNAEYWGLSDGDQIDPYTPAPVEDEETETIEAVFDHRRKEGYESGPDIPEENLEYLIKWKSWSHLHDTWDNYEYLKSFKGIKKLENYMKRIVEEQKFRSHSETTKEEIEQHDINIERRRDEIKDWRTVERITASRGQPPQIEYFVKWKRLHYDEGTWEEEEVIAADFQHCIDDFLEREQNVHIPHRSATYPKGQRPNFIAFKSQPSFITGGELRDYQLHGVNWMYWLWCRNENGILADEMGLGKTVQTISFLNTLYHHRQLYGPFLIVVPLSTSDNWMMEFKQWAPQMNVICYLGNRSAREAIRNTEFYSSHSKKLKFNALITTYEIVLKDRDQLGALRWQYLAVDEAHRLKNSDSQLYEALSSFQTTNRLLITGTPLQNNIKELLALIRFLMPQMDLSDYNFDLDVEDSSQEEKIKALHQSIKSLMLRRLKKDVEKSLPNKTERILRVEMSELQKTYYKHILAKNFDLLTSNSENKKQWLNIAIELKKASNHPFLFPDAETPSTSRIQQLKGLIENSGKMVLLDKLLTRLKSDGHRVLIFSQLVMMLDILSDYMSLRGHPFQRLDGSMKPEDRNKAIEHYNSPGSPDFVFLLSTRAGGMGINLVTADTVIIFDSDWNPQNDLQAMSRAHRIGQTKSVNVYRFVTKGTMEEDIIERAKRKMVLEYCIIKQMDTSGHSLLLTDQQQQQLSATNKRDIPFNKAEMSAVLKFGAKNMFESENSSEPMKEIDLDDILARAEQTETLEGENSALGSSDFLAQFKITDYGGTAEDLSWDDIIPVEERHKIEEEQAREDQAALLERAAKRGRIRYNENPEEESKPTRRRTTTKKQTTPSDELSERGRRAIVRAVLKYGDLEARYSEVTHDFDLDQKNKDLILSLYQDLIAVCKEKVREQAIANQSLTDKADATDEVLLRELRHTKQKAILFTWRDVQSVNAGQIFQRHHDMKVLARRLGPIADPSKFRVSLGAKRVQGWSCSWGPKEDAMLLVGVHRHGFGSWQLIQQDTPLGLGDKFFIGNDDEKKTPKAIHLVRRAEQMMKILAEEDKMREGQANVNSKKGPRSKQQSRKEQELLQKTPEPVPEDISIKKRKRPDPVTPVTPPAKRKTEKENKVPEREYNDSLAYESMRPIKHTLIKLRDDASKAVGAEKAQIIKDCMLRIGKHIEREVADHHRRGDDHLKRDLWTYTSKYWPGTVTYRDLINVYEKILAATKAQDRHRSPSPSRHTSRDSAHRRSSSSRKEHRRHDDDKHRSSSHRDDYHRRDKRTYDKR